MIYPVIMTFPEYEFSDKYPVIMTDYFPLTFSYHMTISINTHISQQL